MNMRTELTESIDRENLKFTSAVKAHLANLTQFDGPSLHWLMVEDYQFSKRNTGFLAAAASMAKALDTRAVELELRRNLAEENGHARMYKRALLEIGVDTELREPFAPTADFFDALSALISADPSTMLGAMYATETAAIFEHEVFRDVSKEVLDRLDICWEGARLKHFHDMHLSGVEQSHKDELGIFLHGLPVGHDPQTRASATIDPVAARNGALRAIQAMKIWWHELLEQLKRRRPTRPTIASRCMPINGLPSEVHA
jgi:hypothetical protein